MFADTIFACYNIFYGAAIALRAFIDAMRYAALAMILPSLHATRDDVATLDMFAFFRHDAYADYYASPRCH